MDINGSEVGQFVSGCRFENNLESALIVTGDGKSDVRIHNNIFCKNSTALILRGINSKIKDNTFIANGFAIYCNPRDFSNAHESDEEEDDEFEEYNSFDKEAENVEIELINNVFQGNRTDLKIFS